MKKSLISAIAAAVLMTSAAAIATVMTPVRKLADHLPKLDLETELPEHFGDWKLDRRPGAIVNPQQTELMKRLYSQMLSRTYVNSNGYRIMLSVAYGEDQRDANQIHYPEVCYPAQGFQITRNTSGKIVLDIGEISVKRLESHQSEQRFEPITYWTTIGDQAITGGTKKKIVEMKYGVRGEIPDGMLFRISSIDRDSSAAFRMHEDFVSALVPAIKPAARKRIAGL